MAVLAEVEAVLEGQTLQKRLQSPGTGDTPSGPPPPYRADPPAAPAAPDEPPVAFRGTEAAPAELTAVVLRAPAGAGERPRRVRLRQRLKAFRPDLHERVEAGELPISRAAIAAGQPRRVVRCRRQTDRIQSFQPQPRAAVEGWGVALVSGWTSAATTAPVSRSTGCSGL